MYGDSQIDFRNRNCEENKIDKLVFVTSSYLKNMLQWFNIHISKPVSTPLGQQYKLSSDQSLESDEERSYMERMTYASGVGILIYGMVCNRPYLVYVVSVINRFIPNLRKGHWEALKWIFRYIRGSADIGLWFTG